MALVIFYAKPGCGGNARQRALLEASGHTLDVRNLLAEPWTAEGLRRFFGARPVSQWFNMSAPRVKSGEVQPSALSPEAALALLVADPLLIRRPLLQVGNRREAGFEPPLIDAWIGLAVPAVAVTEACVKQSEAGAAGCAPAQSRE
jgi:nitrogenase-associated protein